MTSVITSFIGSVSPTLCPLERSHLRPHERALRLATCVCARVRVFVRPRVIDISNHNGPFKDTINVKSLKLLCVTVVPVEVLPVCTTFRDLDLISRSQRRQAAEAKSRVLRSQSLHWHTAPSLPCAANEHSRRAYVISVLQQR